MSDTSSLLDRIDAELAAVKDRVKQAQQAHLHEHQERQQRLEKFQKQLESLQDIWKPRLDAFINRFGEHVKVTPRLSSTGREASFEFQSNLARIRLRLSATTDQDVRNVILDYNLEIIPVLMKFDSHQQAEWPIDAVDKEEVSNWVDDRLVDFVKTYLSLHENEYYLKDHMVEDPVAKVRFPKFAAGGELAWEGKTYYFIGPETRQEFAKEHGIAAN